MPACLVSLGANLGDRPAALEAAVERLRHAPGVRVHRVSRWYETAPVGGPTGQGPFLNGAVLFDTSLQPLALLDLLQRIENDAGRERRERWEARVLDLDLLLYADQQIHTSRLQVPHPRMGFRRFVLEAAAEIAPYLVHPEFGWTVGQLLEHLNQAWPYLALAGTPGVGRLAIAEAILSARPGRLLAVPRPRPWQVARHRPAPMITEETAKAEPAEPAVPVVAPTGPTEGLSAEPWLASLRWWSDYGVSELDTWMQLRTISDGWFPQLRVEAQLELRGAEWQRFDEAWTKLAPQVHPPKLTVLIDAPAEVLHEHAKIRWPALDALPPLAWFTAYRHAMLEACAEKNLGPILRIDWTVGLNRIVGDIIAALDAME